MDFLFGGNRNIIKQTIHNQCPNKIDYNLSLKENSICKKHLDSLRSYNEVTNSTFLVINDNCWCKPMDYILYYWKYYVT